MSQLPSGPERPNRQSTFVVPCTACPLRKRESFREFTPEELAFMLRFKQGELRVDAGGTVLMEGASSPHLYTVLDGWAFRYKTLPDGRRQILNYLLPGDLVGLQGAAFGALDHGVEALTDLLLCVFSRQDLWGVFTGFPSLAFDITWLASREERILDDNLLTVGRRTSIESIAFVLWHLHRRAERIGLIRGGVLGFPLTQQHLADTLGLSLVHTNKTLRRLRATGCIVWHDHLLEVRDPDALRRIARVSPPADVALRPFI